MSHESKIQSQDGGIGTYTLPPRTTKRRTITNLKTKNNQNCQKIELYRTVWTTKEIKKKHSSRPVGGAEMGSWGGEDLRRGLVAKQQMVDPARWWIVEQTGQAVRQLADPATPHSCIDKPG